MQAFTTWAHANPELYTLLIGTLLPLVLGLVNIGNGWVSARWPAIGSLMRSWLPIFQNSITKALEAKDVATKTPVKPPVLPLIMLALSAIAVPACAAFVSALPVIIAVANYAAMVLDDIQHFADIWFRTHPDASKQAAVDAAVSKCRAALALAERATAGAEALDQKQVDAAFADFREAYTALLDLVAPIGVKAVGPGVQAPPGGLQVPSAESLTPKVKS